MTTPEETTNLEVISEYFAEFWGKANPDIVDKLCADDFVINYPMHGPRHGKEAAKKMLAEFKEVCTSAPTCPTSKTPLLTSCCHRHSPISLSDRTNTRSSLADPMLWAVGSVAVLTQESPFTI